MKRPRTAGERPAVPRLTPRNPPPGQSRGHRLDSDLQIGLGEQSLDRDRFEPFSGGQHLGVEPGQLTDRRRLILPDGGALRRVEVRHGVPPVGLVLEQHQIGGLVAVHPDDSGHSRVIEPVRLGGLREQAELPGGHLNTLPDMPGEPADHADRIRVLLTLTHRAERRTHQTRAMDMGPAYEKSARKLGHAVNAVICYDPFHVVQLATKALDQVRRSVWQVEAARSGSGEALQGRPMGTSQEPR